MMPLLTKYGGRFLSALPSWDGLPPVNLAPQSEKKAGDRGVCSLPALSNMFWVPTASTGLGEAASQQCFPANSRSDNLALLLIAMVTDRVYFIIINSVYWSALCETWSRFFCFSSLRLTI